jgi:cytokinin dehydrogenase
MSWIEDLARELPGKVLTTAAELDVAASDFGRVVTRRPRALICVQGAGDVACAVKFAARYSLAVATRGSGHSQAGQSLSHDIVLNMSALNQIQEVTEDSATVQAGVTWRALVEHLAPQSLSPPVLTNNLDVTVGGTLSMGGLGVTSWRHGTQADNCREMEVVTGLGEIVRCSPTENRELFDVVRCGSGQFGIITQAKIRLRRHKVLYRTFYLLYDTLALLLDDLKVVMTDERFDCLESWCVPCPQGFKKVSGQRQPFAEWFFPLHATVELDAAEPPEEALEKLAGLKFYKHVHTEDGAMAEFFTRLDALFALWKRGGFWDYAHPWMECILPWQATSTYLSQVLANFPPQALVGGHILLWPALGNAAESPLLMRPPGEFLMGVGILPAVPPQFLTEVLPRMTAASQASTMMGGKRYLSGWLDYDAAAWKAHYGDKWPAVVEAKRKFDPHGILNPGFIKFE